ncbi:LexA family transcriptional regulator [Aggregatibacter actinomycetemcomitans]|uniref:LexA family transcriptional regulator n=1 Tax=Aggregatibacter actinomycetemcomitans TaxID=714 RepID=UPI001E4FC8E7|nr:helix-turn-helix transcriptional regulator [Aggregatibacter actinomycetemcomitans]
MSKAKINDRAFAERMQLLLKTKFNGNSSKFAKEIGIAVTSLNRWLIGEADPSRSNLVKATEVTEVSVEWLATGKENQSNASAFKDNMECISMINCFCSINVSAGYGSFNEGVTQPDGQAPYSETLLHKLGVKARYCAVFWADGVSMRPTIDDGDQILVDLSKKEIKGDKIYLVQNGASVWVKRVKINWDGLELISDNKEEYPPIQLTQAEAENLQIIGQVVHIGKNLI